MEGISGTTLINPVGFINSSTSSFVSNPATTGVSSGPYQVYVSTTGANTGNGNINAPFLTIAYALTYANSIIGPVNIFISPGSYTGSFTIAKDTVSLNGVSTGVYIASIFSITASCTLQNINIPYGVIIQPTVANKSISFNNCNIGDIGQGNNDTVLFNGSSNPTVTFTNCNLQYKSSLPENDVINVQSGSPNMIFNSSYIAVNYQQCTCFRLQGTSATMSINNCIVANTATLNVESLSPLITVYAASNISITNSTFSYTDKTSVTGANRYFISYAISAPNSTTLTNNTISIQKGGDNNIIANAGSSTVSLSQIQNVCLLNGRTIVATNITTVPTYVLS